MAHKKKHKITIITGVAGPAIYINDYRVAGPKPWGGGSLAAEWPVSREDIENALKKGK